MHECKFIHLLTRWYISMMPRRAHPLVSAISRPLLSLLVSYLASLSWADRSGRG